MKKNLAQKLREKTDTIEFRAIRAKLNAIAGDKNKKQEFRALHLLPETITSLQNEGIQITQINEFGTKKYLLTWAVTKEQGLAEKIKWVVDFDEKHISVPQAQLTEAENNSFVAELRAMGFYIQSAIA